MALFQRSIVCFLLISLPTFACAAQKTDAEYMRLAIAQAKLNPKYPFGAIIVDNRTGKVLVQGVNDTNSTHNPTHHGEMVAINRLAALNPNIDWKTTTLYTTAEPCAMCQSAIVWAGIANVVYGTSIANLKAMGWIPIDISAAEVNKKSSFYNGHLKGGVLSQETDQLFKQS